MNPWDDDHDEARFLAAWNSITIERDVHYSLFTFGESELPYYLVLEPKESGGLVTLVRGQVKITRPLIITPDNAEPEFENFFESSADESLARFLLARTASFSHLRMNNQAASRTSYSDSVEEVVARLNRELDREEEDRVAILTAPPALAPMAILRYTAERVMRSAPDNIMELRERGFLP